MTDKMVAYFSTSTWVSNWQLKLNIAKSKLWLTPPKKIPVISSLEYRNCILPIIQTKDLGVILDPSLLFTPNIQSSSQTCCLSLQNIARIWPLPSLQYSQPGARHCHHFPPGLFQQLPDSSLCFCPCPIQLILSTASRMILSKPKGRSYCSYPQTFWKLPNLLAGQAEVLRVANKTLHDLHSPCFSDLISLLPCSLCLGLVILSYPPTHQACSYLSIFALLLPFS